MYQCAYTCTFFCTYSLRYACYEIVSILDDEDASAVTFMKPNDGCASDKDSANENEGCLIDNFSRSQLNAPA